MSVLGIDLGTANCVLATVGRGAVTVVRNEISERLTPSLVTFTNKERLIGEAALSQLKSNYKTTCRGFKNLLGRSFSNSELQLEHEHALAPLVEGLNGTVGYQVSYKGENRVVSAIAATAALLCRLKSIAEKTTGVSAVDIVIACPGWFTDANRRALLAATEIAGLNCRRIMSEHTATALDYGIYRSRDFEESTPHRVAFVAVGHANSSVSIVEFVKGSLKILSEVSYRDLGGRDMDAAIARHFANIFEKQHNMQPMKHLKSKLKLEDQASRIKKVLSANADAQFHVECLMEDYDCDGFITRGEFEEICKENIIPKFHKLLNEAVQMSGVTLEDIHAVEVVGGCTRIPWLQNSVSNFFNKAPSKTLSSDECVARGCALQAAMCSSAYRVREFSCWERIFHSIAVAWEGSSSSPSIKNNFNNDEAHMDADNDKRLNQNNKNLSNGTTNENMKSVIVIESGTVSNVVKKLLFERAGSFEVCAFYTEQNKLLPGTPTQLGKCRILLPESPDGALKTVAVRCKLNFHGLFKFDKAELIETEEVEEIVTEKQPKVASDTQKENTDTQMAGSNDNEINSNQNNKTANKNNESMEDVQVRRKAKRTKKTELQIVVTENPINLTTKQIVDLKEEEISMGHDDRVLAETKERMNELEAYIYSMRDKLAGNLQPFVKSEESNNFLKVLEEAEEWLYDNVDAQKSTFVQKLNELQAYGFPIVKRYENYERKKDCINNAFNCIQHQRIFASNPDEKFSHISNEEKQHIINEANMFEHWINDMINKEKSIPLYEDNVAFTAEMVNEKVEALCNLTNKIMLKAKPTPSATTNQQSCSEKQYAENRANENNEEFSNANNCNNDINCDDNPN